MSSPRTIQLANHESILWSAYRRGGAGADTRLLEYYLPLVVRQVERIAIRIRGRADSRDLLSAGVVGLHRAVELWDDRREASFATFATARIRGAILDELRRVDPLTRHQRRQYRLICAAIADLTRQLQATPTPVQIATAVGLSVEKVNTFLAMGQGAIRLDEAVDGRISVADAVADASAPNPREEADRQLSREALRRCFRALPDRDQQLLYLRLYENLRVSEIALAMGISEGRVSQRYQEIVGRLRGLMGLDQRTAA